MDFPATHRLLLCVSFVVATVSAYHWPSPQYDALETALYTRGTLTGRCGHRNGVPESPLVAAEWLRLAYHDMATHNITAGTGGLDSSIYFELDRAENIGQGMIDSLNDFRQESDNYVSRADIIAMGAIWGVASCGGPIIPFRGGRIDAAGAGRSGVPEPQQDLATHTASFRLQGFSPSEMIQLVACGHTLGGVRNLDFPDVVTDPPAPDPDGNNPSGLVIKTFDSTDAFDSNVVTEYLVGTSMNPLVVGQNTSFNSDLRIFSSDGNTTMSSLKEPTVFSTTCGGILTRMLETIPAGVKLTEEIKLLPFKVVDARVVLVDSALQLTATVRLTRPNDGTSDPSANPKLVTLFWCEKSDNALARPCTRTSAHSTNATGPPDPFAIGKSPLMDRMSMAFSTYTFSAPIGNASVSKFWFEVAEPGVPGVVVQNNGGNGYLIDQDVVVFAPTLSSVRLSFEGFSNFSYHFVVGVRNTRTVSQSILNIFDQNSVPPGIPVQFTHAVSLLPDPTIPPLTGFTFYSTNVTVVSSSATLTFDFVVDGKKAKITYLKQSFLSVPTLSGSE